MISHGLTRVRNVFQDFFNVYKSVGTMVVAGPTFRHPLFHPARTRAYQKETRHLFFLSGTVLLQQRGSSCNEPYRNEVSHEETMPSFSSNTGHRSWQGPGVAYGKE